MESSDNQNKNAKNQNNEIDIFDFCKRLWNIFLRILNWIKGILGDIIIFLVRKSLWIGASVIICVVLAVVFFYSTKSAYVSYMEANTNFFNSRVVIESINRLSDVTGNPEILSTTLGITEEQAKQISSIKAYYGIDVNKDGVVDYVDFDEKWNAAKDTSVRINNYFYVQVGVYNEDVFPALRNGLFNYLDSNPYTMALHKLANDQARERIKDLEKSLKDIDSLQMYQISADQSQLRIKDFSLVNKPELKLYYTDHDVLYKQKQELERQLELYRDHPIIVVQDFSALSQLEMPIRKLAIRGGILGIILGLIVALLWQFRKTIWELIREDSSKRAEALVHSHIERDGKSI